ncbi:RHS repeat-associated core domain-containing protein [Achromobacter aloeverae]
MANLCAGTPTITVRDNRGLGVRTLRYNRGVEGAVAAQYVDAYAHNALGQLLSSQDPRFFGGSTLNFRHVPALSGQVLETVSVDAGTSRACADIAGRSFWQYSQGRDSQLRSDNAITVRHYHDALGRPVQRVRATSPLASAAPITLATPATSTVFATSTSSTTPGGTASMRNVGACDLWFYGEASGQPGDTYDPLNAGDPRNANQRGQLLQHFDTAGLLDMSVLGYGMQGQPLRQDRSFLALACDPDNNWIVSDNKPPFTANKSLLEGRDPYATCWTYNALAQVLTQTDAQGHQQHTGYDCAGRKDSTAVTPKGGNRMPVTTAIVYTAADEIDTRSDANGIQVAYAYESQMTGRLVSITALRISESKRPTYTRTEGNIRSGMTRLQALTYTYDGVGNVTALSDDSAGAQVTFFRNRVATPDRSYAYDALYQLTSASGRENYVDNTPKGTDWPGGTFKPSTTPAYRPYTRTYAYDLGGNLTSTGSADWTGATPPTRKLAVGRASNRAVCTANYPGPTPDNIDSYFDSAGKSICVDGNANQPMYWTPLHQLYCVVATYRAPGEVEPDWNDSDREQYAYDGAGQRVRKYGSSKAGSTWNHTDTRYLPGLELRSDTGTGEQLEVIVLEDGARILNWPNGTAKPSDIPNLQLRYQYSDRQHSCMVETDQDGNLITREEYYPYGGTAVLASRSDSEVKYKFIRYSGKERDATGFYYYGLRYYQPWTGRWISPDPAGATDGLNLYRAMGNNPATMTDAFGTVHDDPESAAETAALEAALRDLSLWVDSPPTAGPGHSLAAASHELHEEAPAQDNASELAIDAPSPDGGPAAHASVLRTFRPAPSTFDYRALQAPDALIIFESVIRIVEEVAQAEDPSAALVNLDRSRDRHGRSTTAQASQAARSDDERREFVAKAFDHRISSGTDDGFSGYTTTVLSRPNSTYPSPPESSRVYGEPKSVFRTAFADDKVTIELAFRQEKTSDYFGSDVFAYQASRVAGFDAKRIRIIEYSHVVNFHTRSETEQYLGAFSTGFHDHRTTEDMGRAFLEKTDNGRLTQRMLQHLGKEAISVWRFDYAAAHRAARTVKRQAMSRNLEANFYVFLQDATRPRRQTPGQAPA